MKAHIAIQQGKGISIAQAIKTLIGEEPDADMVKAIENRLTHASALGESIDIKALIPGMLAVQEKWV